MTEQIRELRAKLANVEKGPFADGISDNLKRSIIAANKSHIMAAIRRLEKPLKEQRKAMTFDGGHTVLPKTFMLKTA